MRLAIDHGTEKYIYSAGVNSNFNNAVSKFNNCHEAKDRQQSFENSVLEILSSMVDFMYEDRLTVGVVIL